MIRTSLALLFLSLLAARLTAAEDWTVFEDGSRPADQRLDGLKDLNGYFPFDPPSSKGEWEARRDALRRRVLVATNLWPMWDKTPLKPVIHGKVKRPGFTVEKVYFQSLPNHFVTGLLFRPDTPITGKTRPGVLCPHGHGGRMQDYGEKAMKSLIEQGAEKFEKSGRFPKLARCAQLARMGCTVFIFDMLGYEDSQQISRQLAHRHSRLRPQLENKEAWGFYSTQAELRLQSIMGLQTWNSIRCLDFLEQLPDVDPKRLAVTGGSGGGTQTILLCGIDSRPVAAFPNGMVSTSMQGGCTCENCSLLRVETGNVELAALFAPKPQAMTAADDWTRGMMTKGYPQLQRLYATLGAPENVYCREMLHFKHNYNYVSRQTMYEWFNKHLHLGQKSPIEETDYDPLSDSEATVWNDQHPQPPGGVEVEVALLKDMAKRAAANIPQPQDAASLQSFREIVGGAMETIIGRGVPSSDNVQRKKLHKEKRAGYLLFRDLLRFTPGGEEVPLVSIYPIATEWNGDVVIWLDGKGKRGMFDDQGGLKASVRQLVDGGVSVVSIDMFQQGEFRTGEAPLEQQRKVREKREFAGYTYTYNHTLFARRVHDVLTVVSWVRGDDHQAKRVHLAAFEGAAPIAAAARAIAGSQIDRLAVDTRGFRFVDLKSYRDPDFLPGAVKYGDLPGLLALSAPHATWLGGEEGRVPTLTAQAFKAANAEENIAATNLQSVEDDAVQWLLD